MSRSLTSLSGALCALVLGAAPLAAQPAESAPELGRLIVSVADVENPRKYSVVLIDPTSKKVTTLIPSGEDKSSVAIAVSPSGKVMAVMEDGGGRKLTFRSVAEPDKVVHTLSKGHLWPAFVDETHVVVAGPAKEEPDKVVIKSVDLSSGEEVDMHVVEGRIWDDVPLSLSPDKKRLVFYTRGESSRGLQILDMAEGTVSLLSEKGTFFAWAEDSVHAYVFYKEEKILNRVRVRPGKALEVLGDFGPKSVLGRPLTDEVFVYARFEMNEKFRPKGFEALYLNRKTKEEVLVSKAIPLDEFSLLRCFVKLGASQSFVFVEADPEAKNPRRAERSLVQVRVVEGKVERSVLLEGRQSIGFPISIPKE